MTDRVISKGEQLTLSLTAWGRLGEAMAKHDGHNIFAFGGIPGETVVAEVIGLHRGFIAVKVTEVLEPSPLRVEPPCPYYGQCTGCQWQHVSYEGQMAAKRDKVVDALQRVGGFYNPLVAPVQAAPAEFSYRNHARFTVGPGGHLGFVNRETRRFIQVDRCMIMHDGVNNILEQLQGKCAETSQLSVRSGRDTGDFLVQPLLAGLIERLDTGQQSYQESVDGTQFRVSSPSFFQVNVDVAAEAARVVRDGLALTSSDVLLDAYTGVGTFAVLLAPYVSKIIAVEESSAAVSDAKQNASALPNVEFVLGKTEDVLQRLPESPDAVVLDPPRAGCQPGALHSLAKLAPGRVAYVSCDAETLARDLKVLCGNGYYLDRVVPLDMFPQTHHVECVALLSRRPPCNRLILASASPRRRELLAGLGIEFQVSPAGVSEEALAGETPEDMVRRLSLAKAWAVAADMEAGYIIGADSVVVHEGQALGKPSDSAEAQRMLVMLRGTRHHVVTGVTVVDATSGRHLTDCLTSEITLRNLSDSEIESSIATGTPLDKAGAYAVQDSDLRPAASWQGCYTNIVGLPLCRLWEMLEQLGYELEPSSAVKLPEECGRFCPLRHRRSL